MGQGLLEAMIKEDDEEDKELGEERVEGWEERVEGWTRESPQTTSQRHVWHARHHRVLDLVARQRDKRD